MQELRYPFDNEYLLKKKRKIKRELTDSRRLRVGKRIAILGGSTTHEIKEMLELFLLNQDIEPLFYQSEYAQYWQDGVFENPTLKEFNPDIIFIHTTFRNLTELPKPTDTEAQVHDKLESQLNHFRTLWQALDKNYGCPIIQNNIERPPFRLFGNRDISDYRGVSNFVARLNQEFYKYSQQNEKFYINDIDYLAASYGLERWSDPMNWYLYKYALALPAIPELAFSVANIIKSICGKNKKAFVLDLDNTLWGGIVGDDSVQNLSVGPETPIGQAFQEFQGYIKQHKDLGILLNISSKNEMENAIAGLGHQDNLLKEQDFQRIKANWEQKDLNIREIASELALGADSFVFVDDNPAERALVEAQIEGIAVPDIGQVEHYIRRIDKSGFFEVTRLSSEDFARNEMYEANKQREAQQKLFESYSDYLLSLNMTAKIGGFSPEYMQRLAQLTGKSNQFNLTTRRYTIEELEALSQDSSTICISGRLEDKFGDNGLVSIVIAHADGEKAHIDLWLMSCRVLKRDMESAMLDKLTAECKARSITTLFGYYYPTAKNAMVKEFYGNMGFTKVEEDDDGNSTWVLDISAYKQKNHVIKVVSENE